jgi:hypothetical protein
MNRTVLVLGLLITAPVLALQVDRSSDDQIRHEIIQESVGAYLATGHLCACPYNLDRVGHACGRRSAYIRPGGAELLCYPRDVTKGMVQEWLREHP